LLSSSSLFKPWIPFDVLSLNHFYKTKICTMKRILILGVVFALFTTAASAQRGHDATQHQRIQKGFQSGQLTRTEKFRLHNDQARYRHSKRRAVADRRMSPAERRRLSHMKHHDSRRIYAMRHNNRNRVF
jgi:hypothetical protein